MSGPVSVPLTPFPFSIVPTSSQRLPRDSSPGFLNREARHVTQTERAGSGAIVTWRERDEEPVCRTPHAGLLAGRGPKITLLVDRGEVTGFSCLLPCKASPPTCPSVLLSPSSSKEKQEQILHDNTESSSLASNPCAVIQVVKLALSWCLSQSVKYIQAPSVQFPLVFSLNVPFHMPGGIGRAVVKSTRAVWWDVDTALQHTLG